MSSKVIVETTLNGQPQTFLCEPRQSLLEVLRDGLRLLEQREAEEAGKLKALRAAARAGVGALDRGEFKEFGSVEELQSYLNDLSEKIISRAAK